MRNLIHVKLKHAQKSLKIVLNAVFHKYILMVLIKMLKYAKPVNLDTTKQHMVKNALKQTYQIVLDLTMNLLAINALMDSI